MGHVPARLPAPSLPPRNGSLSNVLSGSGSQLRKLLSRLVGGSSLKLRFLLVGCFALTPSLSHAVHTGTTYTGGVMNFCLPGYDSYDWQDCWDSNFTSQDSTMTLLGTSTGAIASRVATLEVWQGTFSSSLNSFTVWQGTASIDLLTIRTATETFRVWQGTMSADFSVWKATSSQDIASLITSTAALAVSTGSLQQTKLSTGTAIPAALVDLSTVNTRFNEVGVATNTHAALSIAGTHGSVSAPTANTIVARDSLGNSSFTAVRLSSAMDAASASISSAMVVNGPLTVVSTVSAYNVTVQKALIIGTVACSTCGIASEYGILSSTWIFSPQWVTNIASAAASSTYNLDWSSAAMTNLVLTGSITITFSKVKAGVCVALDAYQDSTGSRTITWPSGIRWSAPTLTTTAGKFDSLAFCYDGIQIKGYSNLNH